MIKHLYIFSGLGADARVFIRLKQLGLTGAFVPWISPLKDESIENYARRISADITEKDAVLIGVSFGGIMAQEVAKIIKPKRIIIISSVKTANEIPFYYRLAGKMKLHRLVPVILLKSQNPLVNWLFGATSPQAKELLGEVLKNTDSRFLKWAIDKILTWKNCRKLDNVIHLHGKNDRILPSQRVRGADAIVQGGHLMIYEQADEVKEFLDRYLLNESITIQNKYP